MSRLRGLLELWSRFKRRVLKLRIGHYPAIPIVVILVFVVMAIFADFLAPYSPDEISLDNRLTPPSWQAGGSLSHLLGTDELGRDMLSRIMFGARVSLLVAALAIILGGLGGTALGILAGYRGGWMDTVLMRAADATLAFPIILIAMLLVVTLGPSLQNVVIAMSIALWARYARVVRGEVLSIRERDFVALARVAGSSSLRIMVQHIFPNVLNTVVVMLTLQVGWVVVVESSLSFLGAGIPPPSPTWGGMIAKGREFITSAWWVSFFPGVAIVLMVVAFNLMGDWLREALDPKLRQVGGGG